MFINCKPSVMGEMEEDAHIYGHLDRMMQSVVSSLFGDVQRDIVPPAYRTELPQNGILTTSTPSRRALAVINRQICSDRGGRYEEDSDSCSDSDETSRKDKKGKKEGEEEFDGTIMQQRIGTNKDFYSIVRSRNSRLAAQTMGIDHSKDYESMPNADYLITAKTPGEWHIEQIRQKLAKSKTNHVSSIDEPFSLWRRRGGKASVLIDETDFRIAMNKIASRLRMIMTGIREIYDTLVTDVITDDFEMRGSAAFFKANQDGSSYWEHPRIITRKNVNEFKLNLRRDSLQSREIGEWMDIMVTNYMFFIEYVPSNLFVKKAVAQRKRSKFKTDMYIGTFIVRQTVLSLMAFYNVNAIATITLSSDSDSEKYTEKVREKTISEYGLPAMFGWKLLFPFSTENQWNVQNYHLGVDSQLQFPIDLNPTAIAMDTDVARMKRDYYHRLHDLKYGETEEWAESINVSMVRLARKHKRKKAYDVFGQDPWIDKAIVVIPDTKPANLLNTSQIVGLDDPLEKIFHQPRAYQSIFVPIDAKKAKLSVNVSLSMTIIWTDKTIQGQHRKEHHIAYPYGLGSRNPFDTKFPACVEGGPDLAITIPLDVEQYKHKESNIIVSVDPSVGRKVTFSYLVDAYAEFVYQVVPSPSERHKEVRIYGFQFYTEADVTRIALIGLAGTRCDREEIKSAMDISKQLFESSV